MVVSIIKDKLILFSFIGTVVFMLISLFVGFGNFGNPDGKLIVNYSAQGLPVLGDLGTIGSILVIASTIIFINLFFVHFLFNREKFFSRLLSIVNVAVSALIFITLINILSIN